MSATLAEGGIMALPVLPHRREPNGQVVPGDAPLALGAASYSLATPVSLILQV